MDEPEPPTTAIIPVTNRELSMLTSTQESKVQEAIALIQPHLRKNLNPEEETALRRLVVCKRGAIRDRYQKASNKKSRFEEMHHNWLDNNISVPSFLVKKRTRAPFTRPSLPFEDKSIRSQQKQIKKLSDAQEDEESIPLVKATIRTLKKRGEHELAHAFTQVMKDPDLPLKISRLLVTTDPKPFTPEEALKLYQDLCMTSRRYILLRKAVKDKGYKNLFPAYDQIEIAKKQSSDVGRGPSSSSATTTTAESSEINGSTQIPISTTPEVQQLGNLANLTTPEPLLVLPSSLNDTTNVGQDQEIGFDPTLIFQDFKYP